MIFSSPVKESTNALLLTGGGARAAYQIGVLKAIASQLPRNQKSPFKVICGTSAGAINAVSMACHASCFHLGVKKTEWVWKNFKTEQVYVGSWTGVFGYIFKNYFSKYTKTGKFRSTSLLNNKPLENLLSGLIDYKRIDRNILTGHLDAVSIAASSYSDGDSIAFFQSSGNKEWQRAKRKGVKTVLTTRHLMASAAIPLLFPSVKIGNSYFGDGAIHQLSPLSPAVHLGANKILIIGVEQPKQDKYYGESEFHPNTAAITGHLLETIFTDSLNADLERMERINSTLNHTSEDKAGLTKVESLLINPSRCFNKLAAQHYNKMPSAIRFLLRFIGISKKSESAMMSYLMFEKPFTEELIKLGYEDGLKQKDEIMSFLGLTGKQEVN
ncbi:patatin-like phospholipase family protein [Psychrosphaera aquimarina]|uniref:Patatin-like phospholipase family protein n=1 Tax=Psychrosphaera aquimarina TaxID=2044854 RepID=A0ABU3R137_9GAMM|nr:patatin-like phospholipase family protein [Psychrosphaera aquimarina]MDU0113249.1 patatin-like phospholipase family protein [Psychrosphaera aquimarina]